MDKNILKDYVDAVELVRETEEDIRKLQEKKKETAHICVRGSNPEFPYQEQHFSMEGTAFTWKDDKLLLDEEKVLLERKQKADAIRTLAQREVNKAPVRMQRIIRFRYFEKLPWEDIADRMGRACTGDSVRKEFERFLK